jgi:hypothetical protein
MNVELRGLDGIQFIRSGWLEDTDRFNNNASHIPHLRAAEREITETVSEHGGVVVFSLEEADIDRPWYRLDLDYDNYQKVLAELIDTHSHRLPLLPNKILSQLVSEDISALFEQLEDGEPFVFAYNAYARGHGKYLIEDASQLECVLRLQAAFPDKDFATRCEIRPFVETPSDHDTSFRVDVSATGKLVSAALVYSAHTKDLRPVMLRDRWHDLLKDDDEIRFLKIHFEDPESPYYLNARSPRSNISSGGGLIALMGPGSEAELTHYQMETLEAHDIDPSDRKVPTSIKEHASFMGRTAGRHLHPVIGVDFLQDKMQKNWIIDANPGPGVQTYTQCWPEQGADFRRNFVRMRLAAITTIAALHHPE